MLSLPLRMLAALGLLVPALAWSADDCAALPAHQLLREALQAAHGPHNGGFGLDLWATLVDRSGRICALAYSGAGRDAQWPAARLVSAEKAYTANALSLDGLAMATANLYAAMQPGGSLFGLQGTHPPRTELAYAGPAERWGEVDDPLVGQRLGGLVAFGGGLALYDHTGRLLGALGVSGDSACADHAAAWRVRHALQLDYVPAGVGPGGFDQIAFRGPWAQPHCLNPTKEDAVVRSLPAVSRRS
ncbi:MULTISPECIES: heme-binding protein [unclassified Pseudomonas]|uniref:GlcG/HbpS family heme-binding protein n=1 Tax=unclassified Pseudomonas TaxID=196821 RepID=UPI00072FD32E|nr:MULTISPECIES: heme-binding protein [unclassified Pseudomonas]KSW25814.1 hypothetical protein AOX63_19275 [Pseudomonas sp. ADP]OBP12331.1 hypothetical protein BAE52_04995 [Pseudomonas sp. EGD-AKN5]QOF82415.1 heme-binding protein [Pseudomonas sp. ADPe]GLU42121.1 hypothetical protein Pssp01_62140 [Pseudomonas sp. NBRC 100443]